jgi:hypothetical protein
MVQYWCQFFKTEIDKILLPLTDRQRIISQPFCTGTKYSEYSNQRQNNRESWLKQQFYFPRITGTFGQSSESESDKYKDLDLGVSSK